MNSRKLHSLGSIAEICARAVCLLLVVLAVAADAAEASAVGPSLFVTSQIDHAVKEYDGLTGAFIRNAATGVGDPLDAIIGADGNLLVTDGQQDTIKRFDRATGAFIGIFARAVSPMGMTISGGKVYVCQSNPPEIVRSFDAVTGADTGSFVPTVGSYPYPRDAKVANGRLYVAYWNLGTIEMFDVATRQSLGLLFPPGMGGLATPSSLAFGPDGNLYVAYGFFVNRYHPTTGAFLGQFVDTGDRNGLRYAVGIAWGPDANLYVATQNTAGVQRYNGTTGAFIDDFVPPGSGGLTAPLHLSFTAVPNVTITASSGSHGTISPSGDMTVAYGANQTFAITSEAHYHLADVRVDGESVGTVTSYTFTNVTAGHTIEVSFAINTYVLTVSAAGGGTVTRSPDLPEYDYGTSVELIATPAPGHSFVTWSDDAGSSSNPLTVTMDTNQSVTAFFALEIAFDFAPHDLQLNSQGVWVTGFLQPPAPYLASQIAVASIRLNGLLATSSEQAPKIEEHGTRLKVMFSRAAVQPTLDPGDHVPVTVTGMIAGEIFTGTDFIKVKVR